MGEDMPPKIQYAVLYLAFIVASYVFRFTRLALVLLVIHYLAETVFHICRILAYSEKTSISSKLFKLGDLLFVLARLSSVILRPHLLVWFGQAARGAAVSGHRCRELQHRPHQTELSHRRLLPPGLAYVELHCFPVQEDEGDEAEHQRRLRICHEDEEDRAGEGQGQEAEAGAGGQGRRSARG